MLLVKNKDEHQNNRAWCLVRGWAYWCKGESKSSNDKTHKVAQCQSVLMQIWIKTQIKMMPKHVLQMWREAEIKMMPKHVHAKPVDVKWAHALIPDDCTKCSLTQNYSDLAHSKPCELFSYSYPLLQTTTQKSYFKVQMEIL